MLKHIQQTGDTIVEVLIAIAVASMVLSITYATMNRNLLITRSSQERTEATKIAQGQIELLKSYTDAQGHPFSDGTFCLNESSSAAHSSFIGTVPTAALPDDFTKYDPSCTNISGLYNVAIVANHGLYKIYVRWYAVTGGSQDQVILVYQL